MNRQDFYDGKLFDAYRYMGAHKDGDKIRFVTYAPRASRISIIGEFNNWNEEFIVRFFLQIAEEFLKLHFSPTKLKKVRCTNTASTDQMETGRNIVIPMDLRWN